MTRPPDLLALAETPADVAAALAAAPEFAADSDRWQATRAAVRRDLAADLPDADLLVLRALDPADLTPDETARLDAARPGLDAALARHPGLAAAADRVAADAAAFETAWTSHAEPVAVCAPDAPVRNGPAADRAARPAPRKPSRWIWRSVALAGVAGFAAILTTVALRDAGFTTVTAETAQTVALPDGSTAELAAGAVLMIPDADGRRSARQARLRTGDALFRIVRDEARPFAVETPNADVAVLGTVFVVHVEDAGTGHVETDVTLLHGRVTLAVRGSDRAVELAPGQSSRVVALDAPTVPTAADRGAALAFLPDVAVRDMPARDVARRLAERFGVAVDVDPALAAETVSARFRSADGPEAAVRALALALGGRVETTGDTLRVVAD